MPEDVTATVEGEKKSRKRDKDLHRGNDDTTTTGSRHSKKRRHKKGSDTQKIIEDDAQNDDEWVEKNIDLDEERVLATSIPTAESLKNVSSAPGPALKRDDWMQTPDTDFFSDLGETRRKKARGLLDRGDPVEQPKKSSREIDVTAPIPTPKAITPGGPGSSWRMMKLRRVYETAEDEGLSVEEVAIDRFGSYEAFEEAKEERRVLDEREAHRFEQSNSATMGRNEGNRSFKFTEKGSSAHSEAFRRPSASSTPSPSSNPMAQSRRADASRIPSQLSQSVTLSHTPIPSVMTPQRTNMSRGLSPSSLNRLQAKVLRAKLMGASDAELLQKEYDDAVKATSSGGIINAGGVRTRTEILPTLDGQGRLYDVGQGRNDDLTILPGNKRKRPEKVETRDPKTGDIVRYNADDDTTSLGEMLRQERMGGGMADQKNLDAQLARQIMGDGKYQNDLDYIDDNAEKLGRAKMRSDGMKRQFAIHDYKKTQKVLASCPFCFGSDDSPPKAPLVATGTRVYLSCTNNEELVDGHCLIVPIQHHLTMLEGDDDVWDEVKNFMKCLIRMHAEKNQGVVFYETVISLKWQKHTVIECIPLPSDKFDDLPQYFKESILSSEAEWSQHKKLIDFSSRPGGFRRAMVPNLPYFMVQFDHRGEKGYGHIIEGSGEAGGDDDDGAQDDGAKGGGDFPSYFAAEIIGNILDIEPRRWRRPRRVEAVNNGKRIAAFRKQYNQFDWTSMISR